MAIRSYYETQYSLRGNPFPGKATYGEDSQRVYVPEMFGEQRQEFLRKFILAPLENGQPILGAVWSVVPGDPEARGFGKSTLMGEEAKLINKDFGYNTLRLLDVSEEEARSNRILAGYVAFNTKAYGGISSMDAAAFHLMRFILRSADNDGNSAHCRLRELAAARLVSEGRASQGRESDVMVEAVRARFRSLSVSIDIRNLLEEFLFHLASPDSESLDRFLADEVSTWHHDRNGLKYLQILVVFAELAGIEHITFFIDQVEDFTAQSGTAKIQKNVKIIRDALLESEPFSSRASFVFQLHPAAWNRLGDAWRHEDIRPLNWDDPLNASGIVVLKGLETFDAALLLADRCLNDPDIALPTRQRGISPFSEEAMRRIWEATQPRPRYFLRVLHDLLVLGKDEKRPVLDEEFIEPKISGLVARAREIVEETESSDDRLE
jgi:hypothetical protein